MGLYAVRGILQLQHQPVLCANLLDELQCALAPVQVFLFVLQVVLQQVVGGGIILHTLHALHQHLNTRSLDGKVSLDISMGSQIRSRLFMPSNLICLTGIGQHTFISLRHDIADAVAHVNPQVICSICCHVPFSNCNSECYFFNVLIIESNS